MTLVSTAARGSGGTFNGGTITAALAVNPGASESSVALTANATTSGNAQALQSSGRTILDRAGVTGSALRVQRDGSDVLTVDADGKTKLTATADATNTQPALDVNAATAISPLFRLRTNSVDVCTVNKAGDAAFFAPGVGPWFTGDATGVVIAAAQAGASVTLVDSGFNIVVQVTDDGKLGFFNHGASAKPAVTGAKLPSDVALASLLTALSGLGLITDSTT